jgi:hypothetical protein
MILWVRISKFCSATGETVNGVLAQIAQGRLKEGRDWLMAPDGNVFMNSAPKAERVTEEGYQTRFKALPALRGASVGRLSLPNGAGIYFLFLGRELQYVGQSKSLMSRIGQHMYEERIAFDSVSWLSCDVGELNRLESAHIRILRPAMNQRGHEQ